MLKFYCDADSAGRQIYQRLKGNPRQQGSAQSTLSIWARGLPRRQPKPRGLVCELPRVAALGNGRGIDDMRDRFGGTTR